jgi:glycosyltransferase involved in cell wall biosynthesis
MEIESAISRLAVRAAKEVFVLSHKNRIEVEQLYGIDNVIVACPGGYREEDLERLSSGVHFGWANESGPPLVLSLCRLVRKKRVDLLLRAFRSYLDSHSESRAILVIAGDGPERGSLEELSAALALEGRVQFIGFVGDENLSDLYERASVFVSADNADYDLTVMAALAAACKIVITTQYELPGSLQSLRRCFFQSDATPDGLAAAMDQALTSPATLLGEQDRQELGKLTWESYFGTILQRCTEVALSTRRLESATR